MVVAIMGIAAAMVVPAMLQGSTMSLQAAARMIVSDMLYAQNDAIARQANRRVVFDTAHNSYELTDASGTLLDPSEAAGRGSFLVDFSTDSRFSGVTLVSAAFGGQATLEFDPLGTPLVGGAVQISGGGHKYEIDVTDITGRVTICDLSGQ